MSLRTTLLAVVVACVVLLLVVVAGNRGVSNLEPPRLTTSVVIPARSSSIAVPITARVADLERLLNDRIPTTFTSTQAQQAACANAGFAGRIGCQFTGTITRGAITVSGGDADTLRLSIPVSGTVDANEMARFVGRAPISAAAVIDAVVRIGVTGDWHPDAAVAISYRWVVAPSFDVFGRRISAAAVADPIISGLITRLEAAVPECIEMLQPRQRLTTAWGQGFIVVPVNAANPAVWLRITPQALHFSNYSVTDNLLTLGLGMTAVTETFVGARPAAAAVTPLPPPAPIPPGGYSAFRANVPIVADYSGLEQLVTAALKQVKSPSFALRGIGSVAAEFDTVRIHATDGGRLAIGLTLSATTQRQWLRPRGTVWLTALPYIVPGTQRLEIRDVRVGGTPDSASFRLLLAVAQSRLVRDQIGRAMTQDFARQYAKALATAETTLANRRLGDFVLSVTIDTATIGTLQAGATALTLPVAAVGTARLRLDPVARAGPMPSR